MTTYRMYRCNLCGDYLKPTQGTDKEGFGLHYLAPGGDLVLKSVDEAERHICIRCARNVHDELRKVMPADDIRNMGML